jgi:hypothetical protein
MMFPNIQSKFTNSNIAMELSKVNNLNSTNKPVAKKKRKSKKLKQHKSLTDLIEHRKLVYPVDRKWLGNTRELVY